MKVAIVHDFLNQRGGAERLVVTLSRIFPDAPIFTSLYEPASTFDEFRSRDIRTSFMQRLPHSDRTFRALLPLYPLAFRSFDLSGFDLVVSSSTHWAHGVRARGAHHVVYCHNPPRWLYQSEQYLAEGGPAPAWMYGPLRPLLAALRRWDLAAAARPDAYLCNSQVVAERIRGIYGRHAPVVHPPVDVERFGRAAEARRSQAAPGGHYLVVSRLLPYKRVDLAVSVCAERSVPLVVVGEGPARRDLERMAGPSITFAGRVDDEELIRLFAGARALIHCAEEDFGLVLLEANAAGIPGVAFGNGGALETVIQGVTGVLFPEQSGGALMEALNEVERRTWDALALQAHARRFDAKVFEERFLRAVEGSMGKALG